MRELELDEPAALIYCPFRGAAAPADLGRPAARVRARRRVACSPAGRFAWNAFAFDPHIAARLRRALGRTQPDPAPRRLRARRQPDRHHARGRRRRSRSGGSTRAEWEGLLDVAGLEVEALYGWFDRRPFDETSEEFVWVARKPGVSLYDSIAELYDPWSRSVTEDVGFYVEEAKRVGRPGGRARGRHRPDRRADARPGIRVIGVDSSPGMLEVCRRARSWRGSRSCSTCGWAISRSRRSRSASPLVTCPFRSFLHLLTRRTRCARCGRRASCSCRAGGSCSTSSRRARRTSRRRTAAGSSGSRGSSSGPTGTRGARTLTLSVRAARRGATTFALAWLSPRRVARRCSSGRGSRCVGCYGWFDRRPYSGGEDTVWVARRPR